MRGNNLQLLGSVCKLRKRTSMGAPWFITCRIKYLFFFNNKESYMGYYSTGNYVVNQLL